MRFVQPHTFTQNVTALFNLSLLIARHNMPDEDGCHGNSKTLTRLTCKWSHPHKFEHRCGVKSKSSHTFWLTLRLKFVQFDFLVHCKAHKASGEIPEVTFPEWLKYNCSKEITSDGSSKAQTTDSLTYWVLSNVLVTAAAVCPEMAKTSTPSINEQSITTFIVLGKAVHAGYDTWWHTAYKQLVLNDSKCLSELQLRKFKSWQRSI